MTYAVSVHGFPYKLGKTPARPDAIKLRFSQYADIPELRRLVPDLPKRPLGPFGHGHSIREADWGMLGNDTTGCCVFSGAAHETKMLAGMGHQQTWFTAKNVLADYAELTGFDPSKTDKDGNNPTDKGTDMQKAAQYRQNTGIRDGHGNRHLVAGYMGIDPGDLEQHLLALHLFGTVGIGIEVPQFAPVQFNNRQKWDVQSTQTKIVGGHYIPLTFWDGTDLEVVTWGGNQGMTTPFLARYNDESVTYLSTEALTNRKSPEGFDYDALLADLNNIRNA